MNRYRPDLDVQRQPGANVVDVSTESTISCLRCGLTARGSGSGHPHRPHDDIRASVADVEFELVLASCWSCW